MKDLKIIIIVVLSLLVIAFLAKYLQQKEIETSTETSKDNKGFLNFMKDWQFHIF